MTISKACFLSPCRPHSALSAVSSTIWVCPWKSAPTPRMMLALSSIQAGVCTAQAWQGTLHVFCECLVHHSGGAVSGDMKTRRGIAPRLVFPDHQPLPRLPQPGPGPKPGPCMSVESFCCCSGVKTLRASSLYAVPISWIWL